MKKLYFFLLLLPLWGLGGLFGTFASAQVSVELTGKTYTPPQISFTVSWGSKAPYNNKIWVLSQYTKVSASGIGPEDRALVTEVSATGATASTVTGHRGFWLETSGGSGSATVTATLSLASGVEKFNECVYAFDYPPNAVWQCDNTYQLRGSPPFTINGDIIERSNTFGPGTSITSITDATDNPEGIILNAGVIETRTVPAILGYPPQTYTPKSLAASVCENTTYEWRRSGTGGDVTLMDSDELAYDITKDIDAINNPGTYYYRRYASLTGGTIHVPAEGTYKLEVFAPPPSPSGTTTWLNGSTIWTDAVRSTTPCDASQVKDRGETWGFYYHDACWVAHYAIICPSPWYFPGQDKRPVATWFGSAGWFGDGWIDASNVVNQLNYVFWRWATTTRRCVNFNNTTMKFATDCLTDVWIPQRCIADYDY
jgi:hypothetical protein